MDTIRLAMAASRREKLLQEFLDRGTTPERRRQIAVVFTGWDDATQACNRGDNRPDVPRLKEVTVATTNFTEVYNTLQPWSEVCEIKDPPIIIVLLERLGLASCYGDKLVVLGTKSNPMQWLEHTDTMGNTTSYRIM